MGQTRNGYRPILFTVVVRFETQWNKNKEQNFVIPV